MQCMCPMLSEYRDFYQSSLYDNLLRVLSELKIDLKFCLFVFYPRFARRKILVASFILSSLGAIGALLLSVKDDDKG